MRIKETRKGCGLEKAMKKKKKLVWKKVNVRCL